MSTRFALSLLLTVCFIAPTSRAGETGAVACDGAAFSAVDVRPQDTVWLVSTRHLGCANPNDPSDPDLQILQYIPDSGWEDATEDQLFATPAGVSVVFVHGNRNDWDWAITLGWEAYYAMLPSADPATSIRYVMWSWPSDRICGIRRDIRIKAARSDLEAFYLSRFLSNFQPTDQVGLAGFSLGARAICGAMHILAGGEMGWLTPAPRVTDAPQPRVVLMAAAMHSFWLSPGAYHGMAISQVDRMLIQYNSCDQSLRWYSRLDRCNRAQALGYTGAWLGEIGEDRHRIEQADACCHAGRKHATRGYLGSSYLMSEASRYLLWHPLP